MKKFINRNVNVVSFGVQAVASVATIIMDINVFFIVIGIKKRVKLEKK